VFSSQCKRQARFHETAQEWRNRTLVFWFLVCYAATQLGTQLQQRCIQVVRSNKEARKCQTESNGTLSFFLSWVSKTQPNDWTKRMANTRLGTSKGPPSEGPKNHSLSFFLSWVSKTQPNHWTKRMVNIRLTVDHLGPKRLHRTGREGAFSF